MSRLRGSHLRRRRLVFSTVPFCHALPGRVSRSDVPRGAGGVAKPRLGSDLGLEMRPTDKLGSAVKSDGPTGDEGEVFDGAHDLGHDRLGALVRVFQDHGEAADALNQ